MEPPGGGQSRSGPSLLREMKLDERIEAGRAALKGGRWEDAIAAFQASLSERETPEAFEGLGEAHWWLCEARTSAHYRERAYVLFRESGDVASAGRTAINLSIVYLVNLGNEAAARGWVARAERSIGESDPNPVQGWLWLMRGFLDPDPGRVQGYLSQALEWARGSKDPDLELIALGDLGLALVTAGRAKEGLALLDEAMAGTLGGEYKRLETVVFTSCDMLAACNHVGDLKRADQWCRVADDFMRTYSCPFLFARCRVHYGSVLLAKGRWAHAESELRSALEMSKDAGAGPETEALVRLADLRSRQGRFEEAEELMTDLNDALVPLTAAALCLSRGEPAGAVALLQRRIVQLELAYPEIAPSLAMLVDAHIAMGDVNAAEEVRARLDALAKSQEEAYPHALAALASAHLALARTNIEEAVVGIETALKGFAGLDMPLETGRARLELAIAYAATQPDIAGAEAGHALRIFEQLGAQADADAAAAFLRKIGIRRRPSPKKAGVLTKREQEVLHLVGLGLSNPEIAQRLFISRKTAAHHVSNLLAKLSLRNRAEAVAYAARHSPEPPASRSNSQKLG